MTRSNLINVILYLIMLWPAFPIAWDLIDGEWYYAQMMYESGFWSVVFLILTIAVSPMLLLINRIGHGKQIGRWLIRARRHFGITSAIYATLHLLHYIRDAAAVSVIAGEALDVKFAVGWVAFVIMALLAVTSNAASIRRLGPQWKTLHRWVYPAAAFAFLHWYLFDFITSRVLFWGAMFCLPKLVQVVLRRIPKVQAG